MNNPFKTYKTIDESEYVQPVQNLGNTFSDFSIVRPDENKFQDIEPTKKDTKYLDEKPIEKPVEQSKPEVKEQAPIVYDNKPDRRKYLTTVGGDKKSFIKNFTPYAERIAKETGLNKDFILAKTGLETGWGKAMHGYNFGNIITGKYWKGDYVDRGDHNAKGEKITQRFRRYNNLDDATSDYIKFMKGKRYKHLSGLSAEDAAKAIQSTGYAEDPNYSKAILDILKTLHK